MSRSATVPSGRIPRRTRSEAIDRRYGFGEKPTVKVSDTLRAAISVRTSPGAGRFDRVDVALTPVIAWLSNSHLQRWKAAQHWRR